MKVKAEVSGKQSLNHSSAFSASSILDFIFYSNFAVGICTVSAAAAASVYSQASINVYCLIFLFCSTIFIYNLDRLKPSISDQINCPERCQWLEENKSLILNINLLSLSICLWILASQFKVAILICAALLLGLCLAYKAFAKKVPSSKNFLVATVWTSAVAILPNLWNEAPHNPSFIILCFLLALTNTLFFDLRDKKGDMKEGIKSIPMLLSDQNTHRLIILLAIITFSFAIFSKFLLGSLVALCYILLLTFKESRLKYLLADMVLAIPALQLIFS